MPEITSPATAGGLLGKNKLTTEDHKHSETNAGVGIRIPQKIPGIIADADGALPAINGGFL